MFRLEKKINTIA